MMDTEGSSITPESVVLDAVNTSGLTVTLHPLVILNISDQHTRTKMQNGVENQKVFGALLGIQSGREVEIFNSFEVPATEHDGKVTLDKKYLLDKHETLKKVFKDYDFLGWYTTGEGPTYSEIHVHNQILAIGLNESPLFLQLNPTPVPTQRDLPLTMYESLVEIVNGQPQVMFIRGNYRLASSDSERIAVDGVAKAGSGDGSSGLLAHLITQRNAVKMLNVRIKLLASYLEEVMNGKLPPTHAHLRALNSLVNRLPTIQDPQFGEEMMRDIHDVQLLGYLSSMLKGTKQANDLVDKFNFGWPDRKSRRGGSGMPMMFQ